MEKCVFCKIAIGEIPAEKIHENSGFFSIPDKNPRTKGHSLIISKKHFETILNMNSTLGTELIDCIKGTVMRLMKEKTFDGFNIVNNNFEAAGQIIKHFHMHIIPRRKDDNIGKELIFP